MITNEDVQHFQHQLARIATAICADAAMGQDAADGTVDSLTEAVMGITAGLMSVAEAIHALAAAVAKED